MTSYGDSKYIFPGRYNEEKTINKSSLAHAIARLGCVQAFTPRDLRRTVKTRMGEIGIEKSIRDLIQNHTLTDVSSKHYDRYDYLQEKRAALLVWEKYLQELIQRDPNTAQKLKLQLGLKHKASYFLSNH